MHTTINFTTPPSNTFPKPSWTSAFSQGFEGATGLGSSSLRLITLLQHSNSTPPNSPTPTHNSPKHNTTRHTTPQAHHTGRSHYTAWGQPDTSFPTARTYRPEKDATTTGRSHYTAWGQPDTSFPTARTYRPKKRRHYHWTQPLHSVGPAWHKLPNSKDISTQKTTTLPLDAVIRRGASLTQASQQQGLIDPKNDDATTGRSHYTAWGQPDTSFPTARTYRPKKRRHYHWMQSLHGVGPAWHKLPNSKDLSTQKTTTLPLDAASTRRGASLTQASPQQGLIDAKTTTLPLDAVIRRGASLAQASKQQGLIDPKNDDTTTGRSHYTAWGQPDTSFPTARTYRPKKRRHYHWMQSLHGVGPAWHKLPNSKDLSTQKTTTLPLDAVITRRGASLTQASQQQGLIHPKNDDTTTGRRHSAWGQPDTSFPTARTYRPKNDDTTTGCSHYTAWSQHRTQKPTISAVLHVARSWCENDVKTTTKRESGEQGLNLQTSRFKTGTLCYAFGKNSSTFRRKGLNLKGFHQAKKRFKMMLSFYVVHFYFW